VKKGKEIKMLEEVAELVGPKTYPINHNMLQYKHNGLEHGHGAQEESVRMT
jgi:hypothetical protein